MPTVCSVDLLLFEPMGAEHDDAVAELSQTCFGRDSSAAAVRTERERDIAEAWVGSDGGTVAFAFLHVVLDEAELHSIGVAPGRRREGIARALLERVCDALRERGAAKLFLEVSRGNAAAIDLYANMGFVQQSVREAYYADGSDALVMQLTL